jgi:hypothetical protein
MNVEEVVISSGGSRGIVALGAAWQLQRAGYFDQATTFSGSSIGAVIAAGLALGVDCRRMMALAARHPLEPDIAPGNFGLDSGKGLSRFIRRLLGLRAPLTLGQLRAATGKTLRVCVCNLTDRRAEYWDAASRPDMDVLKALRISCSVPLIFSAVTLEGRVYVDGAVACPLPTACPRRALGIEFASVARPVVTAHDYLDAMQAVRPSARQAPRYSVSLDPGALDPFNFGLDAAAMRQAFASGRRQASAWIKKNV